MSKKRQQATNVSEKRSKSLKRIGTSSPFRNKDGSLDKRRIDPQTGQPKNKSIQRIDKDKGFETDEDLEGTA